MFRDDRRPTHIYKNDRNPWYKENGKQENSSKILESFFINCEIENKWKGSECAIIIPKQAESSPAEVNQEAINLFS